MTEELKKLLPNFLQEGTECDDINGHICQIVNLLLKGNITFLCGAGLSKKSGYKLFGELVEDMIRGILGIDPADRTKDGLVQNLVKAFPPEAIADAYSTNTDRPRLRQFLEERLLEQNIESVPHEGHRVFSYLANKQFLDRIYTTNFDDLIKRQLGKQAEYVTDQNISDFDKIIKRGSIAIIHLHGRIEKGIETKFLITESETYTLETPLSYLYQADLVKNWFVFLGYSMNDQDLKSIYFYTQAIMKRTSSDKKNYVVSFFKDDEKEKWRIAKRVWKARNMELIPMDASNFLIYLQAELKYRNRQRAKDLLASRSEISPPECQTKIERIQNRAPGLTEDMAIITLADYENIEGVEELL